ncbi:methyltransferase family protein [Nocardioides sp. Root190]|uniref:methyltransferase family protein n=1 Tax=Nocardioides sp. Root190 TaxID=1736488 RepID=UPI0009EB2C73|nr:isoprenylcysteine carboxylmethyltransferase family protein [Nocardioides sp. Root190]
MAWVALVLFCTYFLIGFVIRTAVHVWHTGDSGFRGLTGTPGSAEWWAGVLFAAALLVGIFGPLAGIAGLPVLPLLDHVGVQAVGIAIAVGGIAGVLVTQVAMGQSWRVGVEESECTEFVARGPFAVVRNPFFTTTLLTGGGIALAVPNALAVVGWALLLVAIQLQVRVVEEPYLRRQHGAMYEHYLHSVGRFFPGVGLESASHASAKVGRARRARSGRSR